MSDPYLEVRNLKKYYDTGGLLGGNPVKAVDGVSFDVQQGETLGLVGESGCGKTTLGRTILNLEDATEGEVTSDGRDVSSISGKELREWQRDAQMVFQDPDSSLNDRMTVGEIIREPLDAHDWKTSGERRDRVFDLLEKVGLREEHYYRYPHQFSGGQSQRIGIARALALEPEFLVLDEPVSALDVSVQARIINLLEQLQDDLGLTYLFIAHDLSVVRHIADRTAVMYLGEVMELGDTEDVFNDPAHPYTESLLSAIPGSLSDTGDRITLRGTPPSPRNPPSGCRFSTRCPAKIRPEEYSLEGHQWEAVDELYTVLRARANQEFSLLKELKKRLGLEDAETVDELLVSLFEGATIVDQGRVDLPLGEEEAAIVREAADLARQGENAEASARITEAFGSVCSEEHPEAVDVGDGRQSRCLRHGEEYDSPSAVIDQRYRGGSDADADDVPADD
ncbi:oligopeptide/dipeptide ABC transporter, ATPase subunit [halophilic archaeon DL31]|jgi:peptide/nickel transport system ATP-binding protein|nr:oligopeptide/dipeptide ABC transporter, ATPase subunit [halophilic archaeon DL31]